MLPFKLNQEVHNVAHLPVKVRLRSAVDVSPCERVQLLWECNVM